MCACPFVCVCMSVCVCVSAHFNYKPITGFSRAIGAQVSIRCQTGYVWSNGLAITISTFPSGGVSHPSPPRCESKFVQYEGFFRTLGVSRIELFWNFIWVC